MPSLRTKVPIGPSTIISYAVAAAAALITVIGQLADATEPLGVPSTVWTVISAGLLTVTILGRSWQSAVDAGRNAIRGVPWGPSSIVGFVAAAAAALVPIVGELADASAPLGVPSTVWAVVSAALVAVTSLGRMSQAPDLTDLPAIVDDTALDVTAPDIGDSDQVDLAGNPVNANPPVS